MKAINSDEPSDLFKSWPLTATEASSSTQEKSEVSLGENLFWGSYKNIHKYSADAVNRSGTTLPSLLQKKCTATLKMDGSNLGIHVSTKSRKILTIIGRNSIVWKQKGKFNQLDKLSYGNAKALGKLPMAMREFAFRVAEKLKIDDEIIIYGEAFRFGSKQKFASWHPFGYKIPENNWTLNMLTSDTFDLFNSCSLEQKTEAATDVIVPFNATFVDYKDMHNTLEVSFVSMRSLDRFILR